MIAIVRELTKFYLRPMLAMCSQIAIKLVVLGLLINVRFILFTFLAFSISLTGLPCPFRALMAVPTVRVGMY